MQLQLEEDVCKNYNNNYKINEDGSHHSIMRFLAMSGEVYFNGLRAYPLSFIYYYVYFFS